MGIGSIGSSHNQGRREREAVMCKMIVVLYRRPDFTRERFRLYLQDVHGALAERIPGLLAYRQNHVVDDPTRRDPGWDAVVELWWATREEMEAAWRTPEGQTSTDDLAEFTDVQRTSWSFVDEQIRR
jgi:uncharacterized protein (TIGR02118 family)